MCGNIASIILSHNRAILTPDVKIEYRCNFRSRDEIPLQKWRFTLKIAYHTYNKNHIYCEKKIILGFLENLSRSVSEITKNNLITSNRELAPNCQIHLAVKRFKHNTQDFMENRSSNQKRSQNRLLNIILIEKLFIIKLFDNRQLSNKKSGLFNTSRYKSKLLIKKFEKKS